ncbi:MAG TPA: secretin and TonB N-terminal domain-containing protein [Thiobacillaceae bacterium]|nr:secretin and TonB N-terminal domain-containing protein [Thiobacillaceae bacterium]
MRRTAILIICMLLGACASPVKEGEQLINEGKVDAGMAKLDELVKQDPGNAEYRIAQARNREKIVGQRLIDADRLREQGKLDDAETLYRSVLALDETNWRARNGLDAIQDARQQADKLAQAGKLIEDKKPDQARSLVHEVLVQSPGQTGALNLMRDLNLEDKERSVELKSLAGAYAKKVSLEFREAPLTMVLNALTQQTGLNFILDKDVRPDLRNTIVVRNVPVADAIDLILATNQLDKKVLNANTLLIYPNQPAKHKDYQDMVVRSFYLSNADPKTTLAMIKTLLKTRDVFIDEKLNLLIMRDTPEVISMAEKLVAAQDLAEPEVMLELEVLEVSRTRLLELGIDYPNSATLLPLGGGTGATPPVVLANQLRHISGADIAVSPVSANLNKVDTDTVILANPRIRVKNREKAKIHIGDRVPVITTTSTANVGISDSVTYLDTGLKLEVEPNVYLNDDVGIKLNLEVSSITKQITSQNGTLTYQLGTREASTVLRLKNGETQILAGLINNQEQDSANKIPGLGDLPLIGHLFSSHRNDGAKTEIVLLVTPRIVRNVKQPEPDITEFDSGTDANLGGPPLRLQPAVNVFPQQETLPPPPPQQPFPGQAGATLPGRDVFRPPLAPATPSPVPPQQLTPAPTMGFPPGP